MSDTYNEEFSDLIGEIYVIAPSNRMEGSFTLYRKETEDLSAVLVAAYRVNSDVECTVSVRVQKQTDVSAILDIKYGNTSDIEATVLATSISSIDAVLYVPPHNRLLGSFELFGAPRKEVDLTPVADATTRSRIDKQMINYGDTQSMLVGTSIEGENFESFIDFGNISERIKDINKLESAKLRLHYNGSFVEGTDITLWQPDSIWRELGITYVNKPSPNELLADSYTVNRTKYYIEIDILDVVNSWITGSRINYGLIMQSLSSHATYFNTRESDKPPTLHLQYITTENFSSGRADVDSTLFVYGRGYSDKSAIVNVTSNVGLSYLESTLYVHQIKDPLFEDKESRIAISRPELFGQVRVTYQGTNDLESTLTVLYSDLSDIETNLVISKPDLSATLTVSPYKHAFDDLSSELSVKARENSDYNAWLSISKPDLYGELKIIGRGYSDLEAVVRVYEHADLESHLFISKPDLYATIEVKHSVDLEAEIYVKHYEYMESVVDVLQKSDLEATIVAKVFSQIDGELTVSRPDLGAYLYPRVAGESDLESFALIRQLDVADLAATIRIKGRNSGFYFYIL
ncbi:CBM96 family carbohydrate-binding protein [Paenibacillus taichungensis]